MPSPPWVAVVAPLLPVAASAQSVQPTRATGGSDAPVSLPAARPRPPRKQPLRFDASIDKGLTLEHDLFGLEFHVFLYLTGGFRVGDSRAAGFNVVAARPQLRGWALTKNLTFFIQPELAGPSGGPRLLDAHLTYKVHPLLQVQGGQFITPFSRQFLVPPFRLLFTDFAPSTVYFRGNRDRGAMLFGVDHGFEWYAGYFDGNGISNGNGNDNAQGEAVGRLAYNVAGKSSYDEVPQLVSGGSDLHVAVGVSGLHNDKEVTSPTPTGGITKLGSVAVDTLGVDAVVSVGPLYATVEGYYQATRDKPTTEKVHRYGGFAQVGMFVWPRTVQVGARGDLVRFDVDAGPTTRQLAGVLAWYLRGQHLKLQARYAYQNTTTPTANPVLPTGITHDFQLGAQLLF